MKTPLPEPCFDIKPSDYQSEKRVQQEKRVDLECYVKNKGDYNVAWLHEGQLISLNGQILKPTVNIKIDTDLKRKFNLIITNVDQSQKGAYTCQIITSGSNNLDYNLDVLVPPSITRIQSDDIIVLQEGQSITVQCLTQGNPKPKLTWSKKGEKADHTIIDETKSSLTLQNVDETHSDTYSCTAKNGVGNPVTSEFQIYVKYKPKVVLAEQENVNASVMYTSLSRKEQIVCRISAYPEPRVKLMLNNEQQSQGSYTLEENKSVSRQYVLTYSFVGAAKTLGNYNCQAENEMGVSSAQLKVTTMPSEVALNNDKLPVYSDAILFEWSVFSGSAIQELDVHVYAPTSNNTNGTHHVTKTRQVLADGSEAPPTYHNDLIVYKDFYDVSKLHANTSYVVKMRVKNEMNVWSDWSPSLTLKTHADENEKMSKHKGFNIHHHRHHDKKHKNYLQSGSRDLNSKRDRYNTYMDENGAASSSSSIHRLFLAVAMMCSLIGKFYF